MAAEDTEFIRAFNAANPDADTATLRQLKREYPQLGGMVDKILSRRKQAEPDDDATLISDGPAPEAPQATKAAKGKTAGETPAGPEGFNPRLHAGDTSTFRGRVGVHLDALGQRAASLPKPGGIGFLVFAILFFWFAIIPVNGQYTRLALIWAMILGHTSIPGEGEANGGGNVLAADILGSATGGVGSSVQTAPVSSLAKPISGVPSNPISTQMGVGGGPVSGIASGANGVPQRVQPRPPVALGRRGPLAHSAPFHISTLGYQARRLAEQAAQDGTEQ